MSRFGNPHLHYNNMNNTMQQNMPNQPMQQPMMPPGYPMQQMPTGYPMQQPMMPPGYPMQQMPMQGYPMQQPMMPLGYPMQQMPMQGYPMQPGYLMNNRFNQSRGNISNSATDARFGQNVNINTETNRFENNQPTYSQTTELIFENFNSLTKGMKMEKANIIDIDEEVCVDCFEEAVEHIIESYYKNKESDSIACLNGIDVLTMFYNTASVKDKIIKLFDSNDIEFSKNITKLYSEQKEKEAILAIKEINTYFTEEVNEWCFLNVNDKPSIDSFSNDYVDLLDVLTNIGKPVELREYITNKVNSIQKSYKILNSNSPDFGFITLYNFVYLNLLSTECDLNKIVTNDYVYLPKTKNNNLFISLAELVFKEKSDSNYFILVTMDRKVFKIIRNNENKYYITLI